jgi:metallo-beta-lactamase family protein
VHAHLSFLGGAGTVTGSRYLVEAAGRRILVDCGLFQGLKQLRLRNWDPFPVEPARIHAVILTHAHLDHAGYLPLLARSGFNGPVFCTKATQSLCGILLPDSGFLQERDAEYANRQGFSKHKPALPLYTEADARACLTLFRPQEFDAPFELAPGSAACFRKAGHILGAAIVELSLRGTKIVFSGDLGRPDSPTMLDPAVIERADVLLVESTYGDRRHDPRDPEEAIAEIVTRTAARGGTVLVPTFAVGRTQALLYHLDRLKRANRIPDLPVFLDSPMAIDATEILIEHIGEHRLPAAAVRRMCAVARFVRDADESQTLNDGAMPKIILAASGMATGGRVLHHLKILAPDARNTILFSGFQAAGTRGASMLAGAPSVKIHGAYVPIRAEVKTLSMLSAHADRDEILRWLAHFKAPPRLTCVTHGEPTAADALRLAIQERFNWPVRVPEHLDRIDLETLARDRLALRR